MSQPGKITADQITISSIHSNTELTLVQITEDKLRLTLIAHLGAIENKKRWHVPLGVLLAIVPVLLTSEFKDTWNIDKTTWKAFFMFLSAGAGIWLALSIRDAFASTSIDTLVERLKNVAN